MGCGLHYGHRAALHTLSTSRFLSAHFLSSFLHNLSTFFIVCRAYKFGFAHIYITSLISLLIGLYNIILVRNISF